MRLIEEHQALEQRLVSACSSYTDYDGRRIDIPFNDEENAAFQRMTMLEDLMNLSTPIRDTDWGLDMHFRSCPCAPIYHEPSQTIGEALEIYHTRRN